MGGGNAVTGVEKKEEEGGDERSEEEEEERVQDHSLSWDADGGKLAFGLGSQVRLDSIPVRDIIVVLPVSIMACLFAY